MMRRSSRCPWRWCGRFWCDARATTRGRGVDGVRADARVENVRARSRARRRCFLRTWI